MEKAKTPVPAIPDASMAHLPTTHGRGHFDRWWLLVAAVALIILSLVIFIPDPYRRLLIFLRDGLGVTVYVTLITFGLVLVLGLVGGLGRLARNPLINGMASIYVEVIRGIPALVQLLFWQFAVPPIFHSLGNSLHLPFLSGYKGDPITTAILGLTICYGAYMSEVYRAGIQSIQKGQMEAARSLGMTHMQAMRYVVIPQAIRVILPPVGNEFITLLKDSSLVSVVAVPDMVRRGREFMAATFNPIEPWLMIALLYLLMTLFSARLVTFIERKTKIER